MIYLDNAATTKVAKEVLDEMINYYSNDYANSSSKHAFGKKVHEAVKRSRSKVARLINCLDSEIYFTSGATEGINTILKGYIEASIDEGNHIITTKVEHKAVLETCNYLESIGIEVTYLGVDQNGLIDLQELKDAIKEETLLVAVLLINNETGIIQDLPAISEIVANTKSKLFLDATQAIGKLPVDVKNSQIDMLCLSAHKFYGPKGVGAIYIKEGLKIKPLIYGGGQEQELRSGTTNVPSIVGLAKACEIAEVNNPNVKGVMSYLEQRFLENFECDIIGNASQRSPYISNVIFKGIDADVVIGKLTETIVSTGSACTSAINEPSHVLQNMGIEDQLAFGSIRFSISKNTTIEDVDLAILELERFI